MAQLDGLQASLEEARGGSAALRKENEALGTKNAQLTRELFLARRVGACGACEAQEKANGAARPHDEEYAVLLKTNEELTRRIQALEEGRVAAGGRVKRRRASGRSLCSSRGRGA